MQYKAFMIKYAEIGTKGKNRYIFEDILVKNINRKIKLW
jgi:thiamine biosynthesis protein ThiI